MTNISNSESNGGDLVKYTGFYTLNCGPGSFLLIDCNYNYDATSDVSPPISYSAMVTISLDGERSTVYPMGEDCTFADGVLTITEAGQVYAKLSFTPSTAAGYVSALSGTIGNTAVAGQSPFGAIQLATFAATYYVQTGCIAGPQPTYTFAPKLVIAADGGLKFAPADDGTLVDIPVYWYDFAMFVVAFECEGKKYTFEMGTSSGWGRVAGNASVGGLLVSIRQNLPVPNL